MVTDFSSSGYFEEELNGRTKILRTAANVKITGRQLNKLFLFLFIVTDVSNCIFLQEAFK